MLPVRLLVLYVIAAMLGVGLALPGLGQTLGAQTHSVRVQQQVAYSPALTVLNGILRHQRRSGPPNFGESRMARRQDETDQKVSILVLVLRRPIKAIPDPNADKQNTSDLNIVSGVSAVQLFFDGDRAEETEAFANKLVGKAVTVEGTLSEAIAPMQFTRLTMSAVKVTAR